MEIANTLNSHSDFKEVSDRVLEKAVELVGADYGALGVLDGDSIVLASFKVAHGRTPGKLIEMIGEHGKSLPIGRFKAIKDILVSGQSTKLLDTQLPLAIRLAFTDADELHEYLFENEGNDLYVTTGTVPLPSDED